MQVAASAGDLPVLAVGFDPPGELAPVAEHLDWSGSFLADPERLLYARLGMRSAPWWRVWSPGTLAFYRRATRDGPVAVGAVDTRQMGGDAVVVGGVAVRRWLPRTPVDRVRPGELIAAARAQTESM